MIKYVDKNDYPDKEKELFEFIQTGTLKDEAFKTKPIGFFQDAMIRFAKNKMSIIAFVFISIIVIMSIFGPMMTPFAFNEQYPANINMPPRIPGLMKFGIADGSLVFNNRRLSNVNNPELFPTGSVLAITNQRTVQGIEMVDVKVDYYVYSGVERYHWFGTDYLGRDIFTRLWRGTRTSLIIAFVATMVNVVLGLIYGSIAGYYGGAADMLMMRFTEILDAIPLLCILLLAIMYLGTTPVTLIIAFILTGWIGTAWTIRTQFYRYKNREYVLAARTLGVGDIKLIFRHILPNGIGPVITRSMIMIPAVMFSESFLAFLGIGIRAPEPSIGTMLNDGFGTLLTHPFQAFFPSVLISILMISFNLFANGLREALDPTRRGEA